MRIDACRGGNVAVTEPFLDLLHADAVGVQETGTAVTERHNPFFSRNVGKCVVR